jgi:Tol biopolymer transport system component
MSNSRQRLASAVVIAAGLAGVAASPVLAVGSPSMSMNAPATVPANEQVALVNETGAQPVGTKSHMEGTAQVASRDGSSVVFSTDAALVPWDTNGAEDVYLRHRPDDITILVSARKNRVGNDASLWPTISDDGRYVAYATYATNLARGLKGDAIDIVFRDLHSTAATLLSRGQDGKASPKDSLFPVISGNGMSVSFQTEGRLSHRDRDRRTDVYVHNLLKGSTQQVSLLPGDGGDVRGHVLNGDVSHNGRYVTFGNSTELWVRDLREQETRRFHREPTTAPCNDAHAGSAGRPAISGNGRYAAFSTCAVELVGQDGAAADIFRIDLKTGERVRVTRGNGHSYLPSLSHNGRYVGFGSDASDLVAGDDEGQSDAFWADLVSGENRRASQGPDGAGGNRRSATAGAAISGSGHALVYQSCASNLVTGDTSEYEEIFTWSAGAR